MNPVYAKKLGLFIKKIKIKTPKIDECFLEILEIAILVIILITVFSSYDNFDSQDNHNSHNKFFILGQIGKSFTLSKIFLLANASMIFHLL